MAIYYVTRIMTRSSVTATIKANCAGPWAKLQFLIALACPHKSQHCDYRRKWFNKQ